MAVDPETMEELLADVEAGERALRPFRPGEVLVDLGGRSAGVLSLREASGEGINVAIGGHILAAVVQPEGPDGRAVLSIEAEVVEANRGGLVVDVSLRGIVPLSQLASVGNLGTTGGQGQSSPLSCVRSSASGCR